MSAAPVPPIGPSSKGLFLVPPIQPKQVPPVQPQPRETAVDRHPWLWVLIAGSIAMSVAVLFVGTLLSWLLLRGTGIDATW
ncbi:MAG TPA: hypothetical protein VIX19_01865 [Terriglobales bacterium]